MFNTAVPLDIAVSAMMICEQQAFVRDHFTGTSTAEKNHRILQGGLIDAVDVFCREFETLCLHVSNPLRDQDREPHPFVRPEGLEQED